MNWKKAIFLFLASTGFAYSQDTELPVHHEILEKKLTLAERDFEIATQMFDPYYTGPLLAPGVTIPAPGHVAIQPYLFLTNTYGRYDNNGKAENIPNIYTVQGNFLAFVGFTPWLGLQISAGYTGNWREQSSGNGWNDTSLTLLIPVVKETPYIPGVLLGIRESFPSGRFQYLNPNKGGLDATGTGAYRTSVWLNFAKIVWAVPRHPMRFRLSTQYSLPYHVPVNDFNSFGGGNGTRGTVRLPNAFSGDFGYEYSLTQTMALALDVVYNYSGSVKFKGFPGCTRDGTLAGVGGPPSQDVSLAPAFEYNLNSSSGLIGGPWFSVWGKNAAQFVTIVISYYASW